MLVKQYQIERLTERRDAEEVSAFMMSDQSFDDTRYTPGELRHFRELPFRAADGEFIFWYARNEEGKVIGINVMGENEQQTGGYRWEYLVVHRDYRKLGVAAGFLEEMYRYLAEVKARYIEGCSCDLPEYKTIQGMFERQGFTLIGRIPDYYYEGEDRLIYYRKLV
ncbi:GNAT family N-acetyltransferase [Paenibacillus soyae]|uniref:GNAT family N-acetyltransferase n=1 Tax=Paenibacillus soyae TaxID=2969249 RepID=A0A9X2MLS7_9BACL|nr:GNAT family N-acetyltransferase [Paenibacillus soyae]MCR2802454.1 GNAT family N-acetyltransferase [Paenibacillus soyae]